MTYGDFDTICRNYPGSICNLFFRQLLVHPADGTSAAPDAALGITGDVQQFVARAGVGVNPSCTIPRMSAAGGQPGSVGNVAVIVTAGLSVLVMLVLAAHAVRRLAAVGRREIILLLYFYLFACVFQLLDTGSFLRQGTKAIVWITAVHVGILVAFFWTLLWTSLLGFQWVEDGTPASLLPWLVGTVILTVGSTYIALDSAFSIDKSAYFASRPPASLSNAWLFSLTIVWPLAASVLYFFVTAFVILFVLRERRPILFLFTAAFLFALGEGARFALWHKICTGTSAKVDGAFVATILETMAVVALYLQWVSITEASWQQSDKQSDIGTEAYD